MEFDRQTADGTELRCLNGLGLESLTRLGDRWTFAFDSGTKLIVGCLWRLMENGRIRITSDDDGHQFGLPAPTDVVELINIRLAGASVASADVRPGSLDVELRFSNGQLLQVIPNSAGYEAWELENGNTQIIAVGGGNLAVFGRADSN